MFIYDSSGNQEQDHRSNTGVASKEVVSVIIPEVLSLVCNIGATLGCLLFCYLLGTYDKGFN